MTEDELIDRAAIDDLLTNVGGDIEFLTELMEEFFLDSTQQLSTMRLALKADDSESFRRAAHSLKSNSASFGATHLTALCKELEALGKVGKLADAVDILDEAEALYESTKPALEAVLSEEKE